MQSNSTDTLDGQIQIPRAAAWLGATGLLPFLIGSTALWTLPIAGIELAAKLTIGYGAIIQGARAAIAFTMLTRILGTCCASR